MDTGALVALTLVATLVAAGAGVARLRHRNRERRLLGGVLLAAALTASTGLVPWLIDAGAGAAVIGAAHQLLVTLTASASFVFLRRVSQVPGSRHWPAAAVTVIAVLQVSVPVAAHWSPPLPLPAPGLPILLTAIWPTATMLLAVATLRSTGRSAPRAHRTGLGVAIVGGTIAGAGALLGAASVSADPTTGLPALLGRTSAAVGAVSLVVLTTGVTLPQLAERLEALRRWITAVRVLSRTRPLISGLSEVAPDWLPVSWDPHSSSVRRPIEQAYGVLVFVRDASFLLQPLVGEHDRAAARRHAAQHCARPVDVEVVALTDACWLALAMVRWRVGQHAVAELDSEFHDEVDEQPDPATASVAAELQYLDALARAWTRTTVLAEFVEERQALDSSSSRAAVRALLDSLLPVQPLRVLPTPPLLRPR